MGLVYREERHVGAAERLDEVVAAEAFRRDVDELELAAAHAGDARLLLLEVDGAIDEGGRQASRTQGVHLILHQRDQGGDDDGRARLHQRGELEAERLAAARRHHDNRVAPREDALDDLALALAESVEAEILAQRRERGVRGGGGGGGHLSVMRREKQAYEGDFTGVGGGP